VQTALAGLGFLLVVVFYPETIHYKRSVELQGLSRGEKAHRMWQWLNPGRIVRLYRYPNLLAAVCIIPRPLMVQIICRFGKELWN
jgi:hypothetical protein